MSYGEEVNLIVMRKKTRTYFMWDNFIFLSKAIHMEINSGKTNKTVHLKMYKLLGAKSGAILE